MHPKLDPKAEAQVVSFVGIDGGKAAPMRIKVKDAASAKELAAAMTKGVEDLSS